MDVHCRSDFAQRGSTGCLDVGALRSQRHYTDRALSEAQYAMERRYKRSAPLPGTEGSNPACSAGESVSRPGVMICGQDVGEVTACSSSSAVCPDGDDPLAHRIGNPLLIGPAVAGGAQGLDRLGTAESHRDLVKFRDAAIAGQGLECATDIGGHGRRGATQEQLAYTG